MGQACKVAAQPAQVQKWPQLKTVSRSEHMHTTQRDLSSSSQGVLRSVWVDLLVFLACFLHVAGLAGWLGDLRKQGGGGLLGSCSCLGRRFCRCLPMPR
jgi:hypothetical protein